MQSKHLKYENMHTNVTLYYSVQGLLDPVTPRNPSLLLLTVRLRLQAAKSQIRHKWFFLEQTILFQQHLADSNLTEFRRTDCNACINGHWFT